jgi:hypothetical protein
MMTLMIITIITIISSEKENWNRRAYKNGCETDLEKHQVFMKYEQENFVSSKKKGTENWKKS